MQCDFSICSQPAAACSVTVDTIFNVKADASYYANNHMAAGKYVYVHTLSGKGTLIYNGNTVSLEKGAYLFQPSGSFYYACDETEWEFWWFEFRAERPLPQGTALLPYEIPLTELYLSSLALLKAERAEAASTVFAACLQLALNSREPELRSEVTIALFAQAQQYIRRHLAEVTVRSLSAALKTEERTLRNIFYKSAAMSPKQYIRNEQFALAEFLLLRTQASISDIAAQLGFDNVFHFSREFKKRYGISPSGFRQKQSPFCPATLARQ